MTSEELTAAMMDMRKGGADFGRLALQNKYSRLLKLEDGYSHSDIISHS